MFMYFAHATWSEKLLTSWNTSVTKGKLSAAARFCEELGMPELSFEKGEQPVTTANNSISNSASDILLLYFPAL
ncbi:MAG: hypothetical protein ACK5L3_12615 [Oscillospiraceae bacterium]